MLPEQWSPRDVYNHSVVIYNVNLTFIVKQQAKRSTTFSINDILNGIFSYLTMNETTNYITHD